MVPDWLSAFHTALADLPTPDLFKRWMGVFTLGAAMQRRVWLRSDSKPVYPNLYVFLCGPAATGKGVALEPGISLLSELEAHHIAPESITAAHLSDALKDANVSVFDSSGIGVQFNALTIISQELGVFLPAYDTIMMSRLTHIYDCKGFSEGTRGRGLIEIPDAHLALIAGCTPARLQNMLPEGAWNEGFMSRVVLVYGAWNGVRQIREERDGADQHLTKAILEGLRQRTSRYGRVRWHESGLAAINHWLAGGSKPVPSHPKLLYYNGRRHWNLMKLCLIFCISRNGDTINEEDFRRAQDLLLETEAYMPDAFKAMRSGGDQEAIEELWHYVYKYNMSRDKPATRQQLVRFLSERVPAHAIDRIIEAMEAGGLLKMDMANKVGKVYVALKPQED